MASVHRRGDVNSGYWFYTYKNEHGKRRTLKGYKDKRETERVAREVEERARKIREGLIDPAEERAVAQRHRSIDEHIAEYEAVLKTRSTDPRHQRQTMKSIHDAAEALSWTRITGIDAAQVEQWLVDRQAARGFSNRTFNGYLVAIKGFTRWLNRTGRLSADPLAMLSRRNEDKDRRRQRRELNTSELAALIEAAQNGPDLGGISGPDRAMLYSTIIATGFRESETFSLTPESFELDHADGPSVVVTAAYSKDRRQTRQPLPPEFAEQLRPWLAHAKHGHCLWKKPQKPCQTLLQPDLAAAGVPYQNAAGEYADFHSLRHSYITRLLRSGVSVPVTQRLARHKTPDLTLRVYAHVNQDEQRAALGAAFGPAPANGQIPTKNGHVRPPEAQSEAPARMRSRMRGAHTASLADALDRTMADLIGCITDGNRLEYKSKMGKDFRTFLQEAAAPRTGEKESTPRRTRTFNPLIKSQLLYQLS